MRERDLKKSIETILEILERRQELEIVRGVDSAIIKRRGSTMIGWLGVLMTNEDKEQLIWSAIDPGKPVRRFRNTWKKEGTNLIGYHDDADTLVEVIQGDMDLL